MVRQVIIAAVALAILTVGVASWQGYVHVNLGQRSTTACARPRAAVNAPVTVCEQATAIAIATSYAVGDVTANAALDASVMAGRTPPPTSATRPSFSEADAETMVRRYGYTPKIVDQYCATCLLHVIVGERLSGNALLSWAFFFTDGGYVGTDTADPTVNLPLDVVWRGGATVALNYILYRPGDPLCCPTGGAATVRYHWDGAHVVPLDPNPSSP